MVGLQRGVFSKQMCFFVYMMTHPHFTDSTHNQFKGKHHRALDVKQTTVFLLNTFKISDRDCCHTEAKEILSIVIIQRGWKRKILNIHEVLHNIKLLGSHNVTVVTFEQHSLREQMRIAYCSDILIGVHGAGLAW